MKIIAYFLPQFHEVKENNIWWGKGFTEWTNVKAAKSYYKYHTQPNIPLNNNYYNLLDKKTMEWQCNIAKENKIYGFCYYHYWFEGRKLLEKPAEKLLEYRDIEQKFCFCWANHTWRKTWNGSQEVLVEQTYGSEEEWKNHIEYLMKFFKDSRYIKKDNKPIFMIYDTMNIKQLDERIEFYNNECIKNGFSGIYIIESLNSIKKEPCSTKSDAITLREPSVALTANSKISNFIMTVKSHKKNKWFKPYTCDFKKIYNKSIEVASNYKSEKDIILGSFTGWDSTPRHKNRGYIIKNSTPEDFQKYLIKQKKLIETRKFSEFLFVNAWNEWAEGMMLEPTEKYEHRYLEAIKEVIDSNR